MNNKGFTLIEMMVTVAIIAVFATVAVPSFGSLIEANRLTTQTNSLITSIAFARHEAVMRGQVTSIAALDPSSSSNEWGKGWRVFIDANGNTQFDNGELELRLVDKLDNTTVFDSLDNVSVLSFGNRGLPSPAGQPARTFRVKATSCSGEKANTVTMTAIGGTSSKKSNC